MPMKIFAIVGKSNTGKTRLLQKLIRELKKRGNSVGVIKHYPHGFDLGARGKDSWQCMEAGSDGVAMISPECLAVIQKQGDRSDSFGIAADFFRNFDIILVEGGRKNKSLKKIEMLRKGITERLECSLEELAAVVSDVEVSVERPVFHPDQISSIVDFMETEFEYRKSRIVLGMISSLEGINENPQHIVLSVKRKGKNNEKF